MQVKWDVKSKVGEEGCLKSYNLFSFLACISRNLAHEPAIQLKKQMVLIAEGNMPV